MEDPQNGWFIVQVPIQRDDLRVHFRKPPFFFNNPILICAKRPIAVATLHCFKFWTPHPHAGPVVWCLFIWELLKRTGSFPIGLSSGTGECTWICRSGGTWHPLSQIQAMENGPCLEDVC